MEVISNYQTPVIIIKSKQRSKEMFLYMQSIKKKEEMEKFNLEVKTQKQVKEVGLLYPGPLTAAVKNCS